MASKKRTAILVGCNYPDTQYQLYGCINDVQTMQNLLIDRFNYVKKDIKIMTDAADSSEKPTGQNIRKALVKMIHDAKKGDILFFYFSGLGTLVTGDGYEQHPAIVSCDFHTVKDDEFRRLVDYLPEGATFTILADSSHSGGLIYKEEEQYINDGTGPGSNNIDWEADYRSKTFNINLNSTSIQSPDIGVHLLEIFGSEASANICSGNSQPAMACSDDNGILLSSCRLSEKSVEVDPNDDQSKAYGAFTNAVKEVLEKYRGEITNRELVKKASDYLGLEGIMQHPRLYCSYMNADAPFLGYVIGKSV